jgi:3-phytase
MVKYVFSFFIFLLMSDTLLASKVADVIAKVSTPPVTSHKDDMDTPMIYVDPNDSRRSLVLGTDKNRNAGGVRIYDLTGEELRFVPVGRVNSIDIHDNFKYKGKQVTLVATTHRGHNSIMLFSLTHPANYKETTLETIKEIPVSIKPYGGCFCQDRNGTTYFMVTSKDGDLQQWKIVGEGNDIQSQLVRHVQVGSIAEGCVANNETGGLFIAQEGVAIWKYDIDPSSGDKRTRVASVGQCLHPDIEGLALYQKDRKGYLIASSQGNSTYCVYDDKSPYAHIGTFRIIDTNNVEGTEQTDGIAVTSAKLPAPFSSGLFVAHDNRTRKGGGSNFKFVAWEEIQDALDSYESRQK